MAILENGVVIGTPEHPAPGWILENTVFGTGHHDTRRIDDVRDRPRRHLIHGSHIGRGSIVDEGTRSWRAAPEPSRSAPGARRT